ncbi:MAG TPA: hypothetical protein VHL57_09280, partial [Flavobacteriales bacterium]|nr:hypothetical protein [Flavobacteriales bacterium]
ATEFVVTGAGTLYLHNTGIDQFNGDLLLNSTGTGGMRFGNATGTSTLAAGRTVGIGSVGYSAGTLHLRGFSQAGTATTVLNLSGSASFLTDVGNVWNGNLVVSAPSVVLHAGSFNGTARFTKTGNVDDWGNGGCVFNGNLDLTNSGTAAFGMGSIGTDQFNGNVQVNNTSTGAIRFGAGGTGAAVLAAAKTLTVGAGGFASGVMLLRNFTQVGTTGQVVNMGSNALLLFQGANTFGGNCTFTAGGMNVAGSTFNGSVKFNKTGSSSESCTGGNIFGSTAEFNLTGTGGLLMAESGTDTYNGDILVTCTSTGNLRFGNGGGVSNLASGHTIAVGPAGFPSGLLLLRNFTQAGSTPQVLSMGTAAALYLYPGSTYNGPVTTTSGALFVLGNTFNANCTFTKTATTADGGSGNNTFNGRTELVVTSTGSLQFGDVGVDAYNGDLVVNNTSIGQIRFGQNGGASNLAAGRTVSVGASGYAGGLLQFRFFTQAGNTPQNLNLSVGAALYFHSGNTFNGPMTSTSGSLYFVGSTFNADSKFTKTGSSSDGSSGSNTFNGRAEFVNTGTGNLQLADAGADVYNGDVVVNNTSTGIIRFGQGGGTSTLASGRTISVGALGFNTGQLSLRFFTQVGSTAQNLVLGTSAVLMFHSGNTFNGPMTSTSGSLYFVGSTFNADSKFTKTGSSSDGSSGSNTFNGRVEFVNTSTGAIQMADAGTDAYNSDLVVNNLSTGSIRFGLGGGSSTLATGRTISVGASGFAAGQLTLRFFTQLGNTAQNLALGSSAALTFHSGSTFNGPMTSTSGTLLFYGSTFNANSKFTKTGSSGDGCQGPNTFNGRAEFVVTGTGALQMADGGADVYNGDIVVSNTSSGAIRFGLGGGTSTLAAGRTISVGALGFNAGQLVLRNFTQLGTTPQNLVLGAAATLTFHSGSVLNGPVTSTSGGLFFYGSTFNADAFFTKTGASGDGSVGGNTFNGNARFDISSGGALQLDQIGGADVFNGNIQLNSTSTGTIGFGASTGSAQLAAGR